MKHKALSKRYDDLEQEVLQALREEITKSELDSKHMDTKVIKVNVFDYEELALIHNDLAFMDSDGLQYGLYTECSLEDLIDILVKI
jgi:hypothetical protein